MNPLTWVRNAFRNAALGGVQDAVEQLSDRDGQAAITVRVELPAIAAPTDEKKQTNRRKD